MEFPWPPLLDWLSRQSPRQNHLHLIFSVWEPVEQAWIEHLSWWLPQVMTPAGARFWSQLLIGAKTNTSRRTKCSALYSWFIFTDWTYKQSLLLPEKSYSMQYRNLFVIGRSTRVLTESPNIMYLAWHISSQLRSTVNPFCPWIYYRNL